MTRHWRHTPCGALQLWCKPGSRFSCWLLILFLQVSSLGQFSRELCCAWYWFWGEKISVLSNFTLRVSCWWISCPLMCRMNSSLLGDRERQVASVLVLLIITNHSFTQSEMRFSASCILVAAVVTCNALVYNARSSAWRPWDVEGQLVTDVINENNEESGWNDCILWHSFSDFLWRAGLSVKPDSCWSLEQLALNP